MKIKEAAEQLRITPRAIRFYEEKGLIEPLKPKANQYREFNEEDILRLQTIVALREAGMPIEDIRKALQEIGGRDHDTFIHYLELQRSVMFSKWLELKQMIETTDEMIGSIKAHHQLSIKDIYTLAEGSRRLREHRVWQDKWNFDHLAGSHDERVASGAEFQDYGKALDLAVKWVVPGRGEAGLDIGIGTGNLAGKLSAMGAQMAGVDQSKEMLKECRKKFPGIETKLGNFLALPYLDGEFDFVVSSFAFRHLTYEQQRLAVDEMRRVLKTHGRICIADLISQGPDVNNRGNDRASAGANEKSRSLDDLLELFDSKGYITKPKLINERIYVMLAVPVK